MLFLGEQLLKAKFFFRNFFWKRFNSGSETKFFSVLFYFGTLERPIICCWNSFTMVFFVFNLRTKYFVSCEQIPQKNASCCSFVFHFFLIVPTKFNLFQRSTNRDQQTPKFVPSQCTVWPRNATYVIFSFLTGSFYPILSLSFHCIPKKNSLF